MGQSEAAATVPRSVPMPTSMAWEPNRSRQSWPMFNSPRTTPISMTAALPICELCAQTTALASGPCLVSTAVSVSNMCVSRRLGRTLVHGPVVALGIGHHARVHLRVQHVVATLPQPVHARAEELLKHG